MTKSLFFPTAKADAASELPAEQQASSDPAAPPTRRIEFSKRPEVGVGADADAATEQRMTRSQCDLDGMTIEALQLHKEEVERKLLAKRETENRAVIDQIVELVNTHNIPVAELVDALGGLKLKRKLGPAVQKYRDPETGLTWSGRGKEPLWLRGKERAKFQIP